MSNSDENNKPWTTRAWAALDYYVGTALSPKEVKSLESHVSENPDDLTCRVVLLGAYREDARDPKHKNYGKAFEHLLWLIYHHPGHDEHEEIGDFWNGCSMLWQLALDEESPRKKVPWRALQKDYAVIDSHWRDALKNHPGDLSVLKNAAAFFRYSAPAIADELYKEIEIQEPNSAFVRRELARRNGDDDWWKI